jgi:RNA polymerase sigma-70 factor (ECF subfamily)
MPLSPDREQTSGETSVARPGTGDLALAEAAAAGDGNAFATLYSSYEKRVYNFCLRLLGSSHDAEDATQEAFIRVLRRLPEIDTADLEFGAYLFTAARNASYDMIDRRKKAEPTDEFPEDLGGHVHRDRADADTDPERSALISSQQASVQDANGRLPERQREVLALRELEEMSYDQIASVMDMKPNAVAQLISRARIRLRAELTAGAGRAVAPAGPDCERALPLIAIRQDGQEGDPADQIWLDTHIAGCASCQVTSEEMAEAGVSYRAWAPVVPAAWLFRDTLAKASEVSGADWSAVKRPDGRSEQPGSAGPPDDPSRGSNAQSGQDGPASSASGRSGRRLLLGVAAGVAVVTVLMAAFAARSLDDSSLDLAPVSNPSAVEETLVERPGENGVDREGDRGPANGGNGNEVFERGAQDTPGGALSPSGSGDPTGNGSGTSGGGGGSDGAAAPGAGTTDPSPTPPPTSTPTPPTRNPTPPTTEPPPTVPPPTTPPSRPPTIPPGGPGPVAPPPGGPGNFSN